MHRRSAPGRVQPSLPRRSARTRRHLRPGTSLEEFFDELNRRRVRYVVLRWFETLPTVDPGEDIDILVADEDLPLLGGMLRSYYLPPPTQKFDVYSVSGLGGSDFQGIPYFTTDLAHRLLDRSVLLRGRYRVPCPEDHFTSMAYHAVYHKGHRSGLPADATTAPSQDAGEHDYGRVLAHLAGEVSLSVPLTLEGLDDHLAGSGLRPPLDTLDKLSESNGWLAERLEKQLGPADADMPGLAVFVLRQRAAQLVDQLCTELLREGWQPLETVVLDEEEARRVTPGVRGGNWGRGPWSVSGGGPAAYVVAYDLRASVRSGLGAADPDRVLVSKLAIRRRLLDAQPPGEPRYNPLHSSDNPRQALDYLAHLQRDGLLARLQHQISRIRTEMIFPYPVVRMLPSQQRRAVTAVVAHPEFGECVCKLFYPSARRFLTRELRARTEFASLPEVPALLEAGENYLLSPLYSDTREHVRRRLPGVTHVQLKPAAALSLARMAAALHARGAFLLDLTPQNLLTDPEHGLKVLDWEFLQDGGGRMPALTAGPTVLGRAPHRPDADMPLGVSTSGDSVVTVFHPLVTGVPTRLLLATPPAVLVPLAEVGMVGTLLVRTLRTAVRETVRGAKRLGRGMARRVLSRLAAGRP